MNIIQPPITRKINLFLRVEQLLRITSLAVFDGANKIIANANPMPAAMIKYIATAASLSLGLISVASLCNWLMGALEFVRASCIPIWMTSDSVTASLAA